MQTSGKSSITSCLVAHRTTKVAGLGLAASLVIFATAGVACSPGSLPPGFNATGAGGSGGTGAAGTGGMGGAGGGGMAPSADTPVANCMKFTTLGQADGWFQMRCGFNAACHGSGAPWTDMTMQAPLWSKLIDKKPVIACAGGNTKLIDKAEWMKSMILVKATQMAPACPSGGMTPGTIMPPPPEMQALPAGTMKAPPLAPDEVTCITEFVKAASGK
jgi:hypothetical protein